MNLSENEFNNTKPLFIFNKDIIKETKNRSADYFS